MIQLPPHSQDKLRLADAPRADRCHFFNSFFYKRLLDCMGGRKCADAAAVRKGYAQVPRYAEIGRDTAEMRPR